MASGVGPTVTATDKDRIVRPAPKKRWTRMPQLRLLPVTIIVASAMLMVRVSDIWTAVRNHELSGLPINRSEAQQPPPPGGRVPGQAPPAAPANATPATAGGSAPGAPAGVQPPVPVSAGSASSAGNGAPPAVQAGAAADAEPPTYTQQEVDVLQKLSARQTELDKREQALVSRENLDKAAEARIDQKIGEMKSVQTQIQSLLKQVDAQDDARMKSLVTIYSAMKPADAARIFEQLDLPVLIGVVSSMKEQTVAPIMAAMDPQKAKDLTNALAQRHASAIEGQSGG